MEIITFGATNADLDVGSGGSLTKSSAQLVSGDNNVLAAIARRLLGKGIFVLWGMIVP